MLEHVGMVADLLQLHDGVHQGLCSSFALSQEMVNGRWFTHCTYMALSSTFMASQEDIIDAVLLLWHLDYKHIHFLSLLLLHSGAAGAQLSRVRVTCSLHGRARATSTQTHKQTTRKCCDPGIEPTTFRIRTSSPSQNDGPQKGDFINYPLLTL